MALPVNGSTHLIPAYYSFYRPRKDQRLSWPSWLTCSGWLTHISGHPSAAGRAQDRESSLARDRRSTTVSRHQLKRSIAVRNCCTRCYGNSRAIYGYMPRWYTRPKTVTHPRTNRARRGSTSFVRRTPLTTTPRRQRVESFRKSYLLIVSFLGVRFLGMGKPAANCPDQLLLHLGLQFLHLRSKPHVG